MRWVVRAIFAVSTLSVVSFLAWRTSVDNFGVVLNPGDSTAGAVYRSDQMRPDDLADRIRELGIRTVLNLRGPNPGDSWYDAERSTVVGEGAELVDMALSSSEWMSREQAQTLAKVLKEAPRPLLIHCYHGSERTGLASAMAHLLTPGQSVESARREFSWRYLYFGLGDGITTFAQFDSYRDWLAGQQKPHSPETFEQWLATDFTPKWPSREQWPYDPYPLVVKSSPPETQVTGRLELNGKSTQ
jgi:protein tyrosine phosphatase (PTP) superfamily phosphohydrolase (DUF442 family)